MAHTTVRLEGKLDHDALSKLGLETREGAPLILDMSAVAYVTSSALAHFAKLSSRRDVRLVRLDPRVRSVVGLAGLDRLIKIFEDEKTALATGSGA
ncbi:MAG TPA: STAS domain-containing protein [Planctomycetota bacterium]|nr:STAS domain-containing protein [Planctomycetota bacterium]